MNFFCGIRHSMASTKVARFTQLSNLKKYNTMDDIRNDITINKTRALLWGQKRLQHVVLKYRVVRSGTIR